MDEKDKRIQELEEEVRLLRDELATIKRLLGLKSDTSSKPPSSDGLRKKPSPHSLREKGKNPSGGQFGHKGSTLARVETPDALIVHSPETCAHCAASLSNAASVGVTRRQVFDIPIPRLEVTEHQVFSKECRCGHITTGSFPEGVRAPVQYGKRVQALVVYMLNQQFIPEDRLQLLMQDVFGASLATGTLATMNSTFANIITPFQDAVLSQSKAASVKHLDETGFRIGGKTQWLHVVSTPTSTHYRTSPKRKDLEPLKGIEGTVVHDHWKSYFQLEKVKHSLCNAHHLREIKALMKIEKEPWAFRMNALLRLANHLKAPPIDRLITLYDQIIERGLAFHATLPPFGKSGRKRRVGHNLLLRLKNFKSDVLRFLTTPDVPFTNNLAEQDIRMMKVKQKISGGFRTTRGAEIFALIRGFLSTSRKQNINIFDAIKRQLV
jgi:transposase